MAFLRRSVGGGFRATYVLSVGVFGLQAIVGLVMMVNGLRPRDLLHIAYGVVPFVALGAAYFYSSNMKPRNESLTLGLAALFTAGLVIRAMTTGR